MTAAVLSAEEIAHFVEHGFVRVRGCLEPELIERWVARSWRRVGYDPRDRSTWTEPRRSLMALEEHEACDVAPRAFGAAAQLVGGAKRLKRFRFGDAFVINYGVGADRPWQPPSARSGGWHVDGDFYLHFLDSPEQALVGVAYWSNVEPRGGGTLIAPDSVRGVARYLADHPEGVLQHDYPIDELVARCSRFEELTGRAGDLFLCHPLMVHTGSFNHSGQPRFMTNPCAVLQEPHRLDRPAPGDHSPLERATLRALGVERFAFKPAAPRRQIVPPRELQQRASLVEERRRLEADSGEGH